MKEPSQLEKKVEALWQVVSNFLSVFRLGGKKPTKEDLITAYKKLNRLN